MRTLFLILMAAGTAFAQSGSHTWSLKDGTIKTGEYVTSGAQFVVIKTHGTNTLLKISELEKYDLIYYQGLRIAELERKLNIGGSSISQPVSILTAPDQWGKCEIQTESGKIKVQLKNIPKSVTTYFANIKQLNEKIEELRLKEKRLRADSARAAANVDNIRYNGDSDIYAVNSIRSQRSATAANLRVDANAAEAEYVEMVKDLAEMERRRNTETSINASPTGEKYYDLACWKCGEK